MEQQPQDQGRIESQSSQHDQVIEISEDLPNVRSKVCSEAPCGFADAGSISEDSKERSASMRKLLIAVAFCFVFMAVEVVGGIKANSLAILTDAAHLLSDVAAFAISLFAIWASGWEATPRQTYGFFRIEILGALVSIQLIWLLAGILVYEATERMIKGSREVNGFLMFLVAAFGLAVNIVMVVLLGHDHGHRHGRGHGHGHGHGRGHGHGHGHGRGHDDHGHRISVSTHDHRNHDDDKHSEEGHGHQHSHEGTTAHDHAHTEPVPSESNGGPEKKKKRLNVNVQGAYLHVLGDCIQSIGVMIGGAVIWIKPEWRVVDLICTLIFSVIILATTINMLRSILEVLMESTPREIDAAKLESGLLEMEEIVAVHELHIWAITVGKILLSCHVKIRPEANADMVLDKVVDYINRVYNISHVTIQIER